MPPGPDLLPVLPTVRADALHSIRPVKLKRTLRDSTEALNPSLVTEVFLISRVSACEIRFGKLAHGVCCGRGMGNWLEGLDGLGVMRMRQVLACSTWNLEMEMGSEMIKRERDDQYIVKEAVWIRPFDREHEALLRSITAEDQAMLYVFT